MQNFNVYRFTISSSNDVIALVEDIENCQGHKILLHIETFLYHTVLMHHLDRELSQRYESLKIVKLLNEDKNHVTLTLFTSNELPDENVEALLIEELYAQTRHLDSELQTSRQKLLERFYTDSLSNLPNLYKLRSDLEQEPQATFIVLNIDNFKLINDFYGLTVGDYILEQFAKTIVEHVDAGTVYRIASDEYGIVTKKHLNFYELKEYLNHLALLFAHLKYEYADTEIFIDVTMASSNSSNEDIFSKVNMALRYAKEHQLGFWIYEDQMHLNKEYESNLKIAAKIRKAIQHSGVVPYFQPIINNETGTIVKFEVLARLIDESGTILSPNLFIPVAKKIKIYNLITKSIIDKSFAIFRNNSYNFSINLSIDDIMNQDIYDYIIHTLATSNMGERVVFELLETEQIHNYKKVRHFITEVRRYNAKIAIDDFGTGFSNFFYMTQLDPDYIKIDGSLIANIDTDANAKIVVETIVNFSNKLGIKTIAEFVHSSTVLSCVKQIGINYSQGFYIDKPRPDISTKL